MRHLKLVLAALAVSAWAAGPLAGAAGAALLAPTYQSSSPEKGAMLDHPPSVVTVTFSEPLDSSSVMSVFDECGGEIDSGPATITLNEMEVGIGKTPVGMYKVVYKAVGLGGVTGDTAGSFEFMVHHGKPCDGGPGGHKGHGKGKGKGKGHDKGHDDHDDHKDGGDDEHDGMDGMTDHSDTSHTGTSSHTSDTHTSGSSGHDDHMGTPTKDGPGGGHGNHGDDPPVDEGPEVTGDTPPVAVGPDGVPAGADAEAMLLGLGLALLVGVLGGWLLRTAGDLA